MRYVLFCVLLSACVSASKSSDGGGKQIVVSYHPIASQIGEQILEDGGNAFDAFVATAAAEYVLNEGVTSVGGQLGALLYIEKNQTTYYLDADFNEPLNPRITTPKAKLGESVLVPGAPAGLEAISKGYGKLPFKKLLQPAIDLAKNGFALSRYFATSLTMPNYQNILKRSEYGRGTFFGDKSLREGDRLKLPLLADFLEKFAEQGSRYVYEGDWAQKFLDEVEAKGGHLTRKDLSNYKVIWWTPPHISYRDVDIYSSGGRAFGGINDLVALKVLERENLKASGTHYSKSAEALELLIRTEDEVKAEAWMQDATLIESTKIVEQGLSDENTEKIWKRVQEKIKKRAPLSSLQVSSVPPLMKSPATHSYQISVIDKEGNAITGTHSIESTPWAEGIFVEGVCLSSAHLLTAFSAKPGERRRSGLAMAIGIRDKKLQFASGAFGSSLIPAELQFIVNVVDYKMSALTAVSTPRFGDPAWNVEMTNAKHFGGLWIDPRIDRQIISTLREHQIPTITQGLVSTGLGALALVAPDGSVSGAVAPSSYLPSQKQDKNSDKKAP